MSATLKFTDYLNNKKKLNVPTTLPIGNEPVMSTGEIGNVTMPKYTDALNGSSFGNTKQQLPAGIQAVQLTEETPKYSDAIKPGIVPTPGYVEEPNAKPSNPVTNPVTTTTEPLSFEEYVLSLKSKADDQYKRDILNAQNTYDQSKSAYGVKAASLSNMGLTGSGYSDYLDSRAYGQMQADKNAAIRTRDESKLAADTRFMDYLNQQESNKTNMFNSLYDNVGNLSNADIDNLAAVNGLSTEQVTALKAGRREKVISALDAAIADGTGYSKADLDRVFDQNVPEEKALYDAYLTKLKDSTGKINDRSFYEKDANNNDVLMDSSKALEMISALEANGVDTTEAKKIYNQYYKIGLHANGGGVKYTSKGSSFKPEKIGDNFKVVNTDSAGNERTFKVENGGKVGEKEPVLKVSTGVSDNQVFYYNGAIYLKYGGSVYKINNRSNPDEYNHLLDLFKKDFG
jgi:hypothetical protein